MNLSKVMSKSQKVAAILEKVAAILDFQMYAYLDFTNASKSFLCQLSCFCCNYKLLGQIKFYLDDFYD